MKPVFTPVFCLSSFLMFAQVNNFNNYKTVNNQYKSGTSINNNIIKTQRHNNAVHYKHTSNQSDNLVLSSACEPAKNTPTNPKHNTTYYSKTDDTYKTKYTLTEEYGYKRTISTNAHPYKSTAVSEIYLNYYDPNKKIISGAYSVPEGMLLLNGKNTLKNADGKIIEQKVYKNGKLVSAKINKDDHEYTYKNNIAMVRLKYNSISYSYNTNYLGSDNDYVCEVKIKDSLDNIYGVRIPAGCFMWNGNMQCPIEFNGYYKVKYVCFAKEYWLDWKFIEYYPNGNIKTEGVLVMNPCSKCIVPVGVWKTYNEDGTLKTEKNYGLRYLRSLPQFKTEMDIAADNKILLFNLHNRYRIRR